MTKVGVFYNYDYMFLNREYVFKMLKLNKRPLDKLFFKGCIPSSIDIYREMFFENMDIDYISDVVAHRDTSNRLHLMDHYWYSESSP